MDNYEFIFFEDRSDAYEQQDEVYCTRLTDQHDRSFDAIYFPHEHDNFIVQTTFDVTEYETQQVSIVAFCFLSVILKSPYT